MALLSNWKQRAKKLKAEAQVLVLAYRDPRTPLAAKILIGLTVGYLLSPVDLIPDFIPVLGILDDLIIVPALIAWSIRLIPGSVLSDARVLVKTQPQRLKKTNWVFAALIVGVWALALYYTLPWLMGLIKSMVR